jgi:hypothetical protein
MIGNATTAHITRRVIAQGKSFRGEISSRRADMPDVGDDKKVRSKNKEGWEGGRGHPKTKAI